MKKYLIIGIASLIAIVGVMFLNSEETSTALPITEEPQPETPIYKGQAISFLGDDSIINDLPKDAVDKRRQLLADLSIKLKENPLDFEGWMTVGFIKKFFNNYEGARDALEYAKYSGVNNALPYLNLGNLYGYYLKDFKKAEGNFLAAVDRDPLESFATRYNLAGFYRDFGMKEKALRYFKEALGFNPDNESIKAEIERLK